MWDYGERSTIFTFWVCVVGVFVCIALIVMYNIQLNNYTCGDKPEKECDDDKTAYENAITSSIIGLIFAFVGVIIFGRNTGYKMFRPNKYIYQ